MKRQIYKTKEEFMEQNEALKAGMPYAEDTSCLKDEVLVGNKVVHNRLCAQAMEGCDGTPGGSPDELTLRRYLRFGVIGQNVLMASPIH